MAYYSGLDGEMYLRESGNWTKLGKVRNWSFSQSQQVLETTALGDTDRTLVDGVRSLSGSCSLFYYHENETEGSVGRLLQKIVKPWDRTVNPDDPGSVDLGETIRSQKATFKLAIDRDRSGNIPGEGNLERYLWVQAYITNITMTMAVGEVLSADLTFESDGAAVANSFSIY